MYRKFPKGGEQGFGFSDQPMNWDWERYKETKCLGNSPWCKGVTETKGRTLVVIDERVNWSVAFHESQNEEAIDMKGRAGPTIGTEVGW